MLNPGTKLGPYEILSPLGVRCMGEVYLTRDGVYEINRQGTIVRRGRVGVARSHHFRRGGLATQTERHPRRQQSGLVLQGSAHLQPLTMRSGPIRQAHV